MSSKYKVLDDQLPNFVTATVVGWVDALSRELYKEIICKSLVFCSEKKGLQLHAWVIMPNHLHLIISCAQGHFIKDVMRDFKKYTSRQIVKAILENDHESRKEWMLNLFAFAGRSNNSTDDYQFWQSDYHPVILDTPAKITGRLDYLHENPVRAGIVWNPQDYKYSSAVDYYTQSMGILPIIRLD